MNYKELSELIYPSLAHTPEEYEAMYPPRDLPEGALVTRLGPSPTGFIHLGNLYGAFVDERLAHQSGGVFFLRIEDIGILNSCDTAKLITLSLITCRGEE